MLGGPHGAGGATIILALVLVSCGSDDGAHDVDGSVPDADGGRADAAGTVLDGGGDAEAPDAFTDAGAGPAFYVRPTGDDASEGTSPDRAWRTLERVNEEDLDPGVRVLLEGGQVFEGTLRLDAGDAGTPEAPVTVSTWGEGRATIRAGDAAGVVVYNAGGVSLSRLEVVGSGRESNGQTGILFFVDLPGDVKLEHVWVDDVEVSGFGETGIVIGANNGNSGFRDVRITHAVSRDNALGGIEVYGAWSEAPTGYAMEDVYIGHCRAHDNPGVAGRSSHSGSGIVIGGVDGGVIERSVAHDNGRLNTAVGGPVGIWAWDSTDVVIQHNESYRNRTDSSADGGGFDLDGGVTNSVMQYNYSHDNDGAGFLLAQYSGAPRPFAGNVVRYNVSQNDARSGRHAAIHFWSAASETADNPIRDIQVYGNTVYLTPSADGDPRALYFHGTETRTHDVAIHNNLFITTAGVPLVDAATAQVGLTVQHNAYWSSGDAFVIRWAGATHDTLAAWRTATGHEEMGGTAVGLAADPRLADPGGGPTLGDADLLETLSAYQVQAGSPLIDAGRDLSTALGLAGELTDYYGGPVPQGAAWDIGAHEAP